MKAIETPTYPLSPEETVTLKAYDTLAPVWDRYANRHWKDDIWYHFTSLLPKNARIIELGCATASHTADLVLSENFSYVGIDFSKEMIAAGQEMLKDVSGVELACMDMRELKFEPQSFDGFISFTSFMHIPKKSFPDALVSVRKILKKSGAGLISIPCGTFEGFYSGIENAPKPYSVCYLPDEFESILEKNGFSISLEAVIGHMLAYVVKAK